MKQTRIGFLTTTAKPVRKTNKYSQTERMVMIMFEEFFKRGGTEAQFNDYLKKDTEDYGATNEQVKRTKKFCYEMIKQVKSDSPIVVKHIQQNIKVRNIGRDLRLWD